MKQLAIATLLAVSLATTPAMNAFARKKGDVYEGYEAFDENCAVCHNADSEERRIGPGLKRLFKKKSMTNGKAATEVNVRATIYSGGNLMAAYSTMLSDAEVDDIIAYLKTL